MTDNIALAPEKRSESACTQGAGQKMLEELSADCKKGITQNRVYDPAQAAQKAVDDKMLDQIEHAHFNYFVHNSDPTTGLTKDRSTVDSAASIAAVGFSLTSYPIGVERGWVSRKEASDYTLKVLRTLWNAPQGDDAKGESGNHGFFYHFLDPKTGARMWNSELSTIDTALLMSGVLFSKDYFTGDSKDEQEIRDLADKLYKRVDWTFMENSDKRISMGWMPESGFIKSDWQGYNEAMILQLLAMGSPTHPLGADAWKNYHATDTVKKYGGQTYIDFPPQFGHQYSQSWVDFRGIMDDQNKKLGFDYFENSRRATLAQNYYGDKNPPGFRGYSKLDWGWTASDGPGDSAPVLHQNVGPFSPRFMPKLGLPNAFDLKTGHSFENLVMRNPQPVAPPATPLMLQPRALVAPLPKFLSYSARGAPDYIDDGTIAPTAAASSIAFAPELVLPTLRHWMKDRPEIWSNEGFKDAFNPTADPKKPSGWVDADTIGIDQGPIVIMTENYRSGMVWDTMKKDPYIIQGLKKAGFTGSWLDKIP